MTDRIAVALKEHAELATTDLVLPPASLISRRGARRRQVRLIAPVAVAGVGVAAFALLMPALVSEPDPRDRVIAGPGQEPTAARPDEDRLTSALQGTRPPTIFKQVTRVEPKQLDPSAWGDRSLIDGVTAISTDDRLSVTWGVVTPALDKAQAEIQAIPMGGAGDGGTFLPEAAADDGTVQSLGYSFDNGYLLTITAWSTNGGVVTIAAGNDPSINPANDRGAALAALARDLLTAAAGP